MKTLLKKGLIVSTMLGLAIVGGASAAQSSVTLEQAKFACDEITPKAGVIFAAYSEDLPEEVLQSIILSDEDVSGWQRGILLQHSKALYNTKKDGWTGKLAQRVFYSMCILYIDAYYTELEPLEKRVL